MKAAFSFCLLGSDCISKIWHNFRRIWSGKYLHSEILWMGKRYWLLFNFSNLHENTLIVSNFQNQHILIYMHIHVLSWGTPFPSRSTCNVSVNSKPYHPPGQFFWWANSPSPGKQRVQNPHPWAYNNKLKPHPQGIFLNYSLQNMKKWDINHVKLQDFIILRWLKDKLDLQLSPIYIIGKSTLINCKTFQLVNTVHISLICLDTIRRLGSIWISSYPFISPCECIYP